MSDLSTTVGRLKLSSPLLAASGTWSYGEDLLSHPGNAGFGAIVTKSVSLEASLGNPNPRIYECDSGMLNAIGLQNIGILSFLRDVEPKLKRSKREFVLSIYAKQEEDFTKLAELTHQSSACAIELNISCPNIAQGGLEFSSDPRVAERIISQVRPIIKKPLWVKLSPNVTAIEEIAAAAEAAGADAISAINTILGMAIDVDQMKPVLGNKRGGLSGPAIRPIAVERVYRIFDRVRIPIVGIGGIRNSRDVLEFVLAGATAVQIGTWNFRDPGASLGILRELESYLKGRKLGSLSELVGRAHG